MSHAHLPPNKNAFPEWRRHFSEHLLRKLDTNSRSSSFKSIAWGNWPNAVNFQISLFNFKTDFSCSVCCWVKTPYLPFGSERLLVILIEIVLLISKEQRSFSPVVVWWLPLPLERVLFSLLGRHPSRFYLPCWQLWMNWMEYNGEGKKKEEWVFETHDWQPP